MFKPVLLALLLLSTGPAYAFTLLGPSADWMTTLLSYDRNVPGVGLGNGAGFGGPMNLGEEYRWNVPEIYYGFSTAFYNYFGERGILEVEKAIAILNALPSMDTVNIDNYPMMSQRLNYQANALFLVDLKSFALSFLVQAIGITDPTRFVFTLRNRWVGPGPAPTNYFVIKRNYDPITWEPSSFINGDLWTYTSILDNQDVPLTYAVTEPVDPLAVNGIALINAPVSSGLPTSRLLPGGFWTGLTRDDVGGLRYIYRTANANVESAPVNATTAGFGGISAGAGGSPWAVPVITPTPGTGGGTGGATTATNFIVTALRPGLGQFRFVRAADPGGFFVSNNVAFTDRVITNNQTISQNLIRPMTVPDIVFDAGDLQQNDSFNLGFQAYLNTQLAWITNGLTQAAGNYGPGVIPSATTTQPSFVLTLQSVGPTYFNVYPFSLSESSATLTFRWASFDGSTNTPFIYPQGISIRAVEDDVLGGGGSSGSGSLIDPWTPIVTVVLPPGTGTGGTTGTGGGTGTTP